MKITKRLSKALRVSLLFTSLAVVLIAPGIVHCSGSVDVPEGSTSIIELS
ncbi:MAG: hypothetical protein AAF462_07690 [Thermodesulfobacteriota bacterium]